MIAPRVADKIIEVNNINFDIKDSKQEDRRIKGANFCQIRMIKRFIHWIPSITWGTQRWNGALPILIKRLSIIKIIKKFRLDNDHLINLMEKALEIKIAEARAWIRKYLRIASELRGDFSFMAKARKAIMFISNPIQAVIQEGAEKAEIEPKTSKNINKVFQGKIIIKKRAMPIFGIWAQKLY